MTASAEFNAPAAEQMLLRGLLRGFLRLFFRGLVRPPMPVSGQRRVLRALTTVTLTPRGVRRSASTLGGRPCEWHRAPGARGGVLLYLHGGAYVLDLQAIQWNLIGGLLERVDAEIIAPKFDAVLDALESGLGGTDLATWTKPDGGYFITLTTLEGTADRIVKLAAEAGVKLTPAGATHPYGLDPQGNVIRIAPTMPTLADLSRMES